jgi:hypothetical protein
VVGLGMRAFDDAERLLLHFIEFSKTIISISWAHQLYKK